MSSAQDSDQAVICDAPASSGVGSSTELRTTRRALISVFWAMLIGNLLIVAFIYKISAQHERDNAYQLLQSIAEFKESAIVHWRIDKMDDANEIQDVGHDTGPLGAVMRGRASPAERERAQGILQRHAITHANHSMTLLSADGSAVLSTARNPVLNTMTRQQLKSVALNGGREMLGFYQDPDGKAMSDIVTPIFDSKEVLLGFLVSTIDLAQSLEGFLPQWLGHTQSGQTRIVIAQNDAPQFLAHNPNEDGMKDSSRNFYPVPANEPALKRAAISYVPEYFESSNAVGDNILVATRPIAETNWILVTQVDAAEALTEARRQVFYLSAGSLLLIVLCGLTVMRLWRLQTRRDQVRWAEEQSQQQALILLQARLNEAQRFGKMGSWERDLATGEVWWSDGMFALYGVSRLAAPRTIDEVMPLIHPDDRDRFMTSTNAPLQPGERGVLEFRALDTTGIPRHVQHQWHRIYDANGKAIKLVGTTQDITERVNSETAMRQQLDMLKTLIDNVPGGVTLFDREFTLRFYNKQYQTLLDFPDDLFKDERPKFETFVRYNAWRGEYGPGDPEVITADAMKRAAIPEPHVIERERPDGTAVEIRGAPLKDGGFVTIYTDITARKQAEQRQHLSEKIIATSPTAILITDPRNRIVFVNPAFSTITGFSLKDVEGKNPKVLASGRHDKAFYESFWQTLHRNDSWSGEIWDRRKDGSVYPKWLSVHVLRDAARKLTNYVAMFTDITERKQAEQRIQHLAHHDPLTGLANRLALESKLDHAIAEAGRHQRSVALLFIDLDRFKMVNDSLGHAVGDLMLMEVAGRLSERLRASDIVARLGGDEFVVVLPDLPDANHAALVAQALLEDLAKPIKAPNTELHTSGSIGIAIYPADGSTVEALMQSADTAMYEAKSAGRNAFRFFTKAMTDLANTRLQLENDLRSALIGEQFELHYQPQVSPVDGRIVGVEALLRWRHPANGMVGPDRFIPVAEETGLIVDIGAWVLEEACQQARLWHDAGFEIRMAVNLSARQLRSDNLLKLVEHTLGKHRLPAGALELEITESALMEHPDQAITILKAIKEMGIELALDDFGTGYSSLAYLKRFPIDRLKIDRSFVSDIETDPNDRAIALSTIALAHSLGLQVTAEGVEEVAQRDFLRENGCDDAQGWYYSKALPADRVTELLARKFLP